jgi:hypothetical protein
MNPIVKRHHRGIVARTLLGEYWNQTKDDESRIANGPSVLKGLITDFDFS